MKHVYGLAAVACAVALACAANVGGAEAATMTTLYDFCSQRACGDGALPNSQIIRDASGNFYGMAEKGGQQDERCGNQGCGVIYEMPATGARKKSSPVTVLYRFCKKKNCKDGFSPAGSLVIDVSGNLYGLTSGGGKTGNGTFFKLAPDGTLTTLYSFCRRTGCPDGNDPEGLTYQGAQSGVAYDGVSPLYGAGVSGGAHNNNGVIFKLVPGDSGKWSESVLYSFCSLASCVDGYGPTSVVADATGALYGTTIGGSGTVFKFQGSSLTTLHAFCSQASCADGQEPFGTDTLDGNGNLFGVTESGGSGDLGVLYRIDSTGTFTKLHDFCSADDSCPDGYLPLAAPYIDTDGNLFGTAEAGGAGIGGVVYELSGTNYQVLYSFCVGGNPCPDGASPHNTLVPDGKGNLVSTVISGGVARHGQGGTIFEITP
jgi:uncharacterized repeat protein (TIGR03803 family)